MKIHRDFSSWAVALAIVAAGTLQQAHAQSYFGGPVEGTLCQAGETVMFACPSGQKQIAVCAAPAGGSPFGTLQYRFGSSSNIELKFPTPSVPPRDYASGNRLGDGGRGTLVYLRLKHGDTSYTVFAEAVAPTYQATDASESSGVIVERQGKILGKRMCNGHERTYAGMLSDSKFLGDAVPIDSQVPPGFPAYRQP